MDSIFNDYFEKSIEHKSEILEKETLFGILEIIDKMHKHAIKDYIHSINDYSTDDGQVKSEIEFKKIYSEQFHLMFDHISKDFKLRLKDLKRELMKRLDIKKQVITEENESEDESEDESDNESRLPPLMKDGRYKTIGKYMVSENCPLINLSEEELDEKFKNVFKGQKQREEEL